MNNLWLKAFTLLLAVLMGLLTATGAGAEIMDVNFSITKIQDIETNAIYARLIVPNGYQPLSNTLYWGTAQWLSPATPVQIAAAAVRNDGNAAMYYNTTITYTYEPTTYVEGGLYYNLYPMLQAMTAAEYADWAANYYLSSLGGADLRLVEEGNQPESLQQYLANRTNYIYSMNAQAMGASVGVNVNQVYCTAADRVYSFDLNGCAYKMEVLTESDQTWISSSTGFIGTNWCMWEVPYSYILLAPASEFDAEQTKFAIFCANTGTSDEFNIAYGNLVTAIAAEISNVISGNINYSSFLSEGTREDSYDNIERFCDYILDQNAYRTSDGDTVKLPSAWEYVYEGSDGQLYVSNSADIPVGANKLTPR